MSTDLSALLSGLKTGVSATDTRGSAILTKRFNLTGAAQNESFSLPNDAANLDGRMIISTAGSAATNTRFKIKQNGVPVIEFVAGSAAGNVTNYSTGSAALLLSPTGASNFSTSPVSATFAVSALADAAVRGALFVRYTRTGNGEL